MQIKLKSIFIENFKGIRQLCVEFGNKTFIDGQNASGKTTIFDAFTWLLFNKNSAGDEKFNIRPLGADGNRIDNVEIKVIGVLDVDGKEVELTKVQKQKWVKKRGAESSELQGNVNSFEIDGYPKSESDYKTFISSIVNEDLFKMITNPQYFTNMKWKDQRDILMKFVSEISDLELAKSKTEFIALIPELEKAPSTEDIQKKYSKSLSDFKKKQAEIPVRIDELSKSLQEIDVSELELQRNGIKESIASIDEKLLDITKQHEEYDKASDGILELKFAMSDLQRKANEGLVKHKNNLDQKLSDKNKELFSISSEYSNLKKHNSFLEDEIEKNSKIKERLFAEWKSINDEIFDESTTICPTCNRDLPLDTVMSLRNGFLESKNKRLEEIEERGLKAKNEIEKANEHIVKNESLMKELLSNEEVIKKEIAVMEKELSELVDSVDISNRSDYAELLKQLEEKENYLSKWENVGCIKKNLNDDRKELVDDLERINIKISSAERNIAIEERIAELQSEQREVSQKVADQERMLYLLEQFIKEKMMRVSETINSKFNTVSWKLFENQINGGMRECCECTVNGVPYSTLNNGHRIVAGLDIIRSLSELYSVSASIFVDNAECINNFNIPEMEQQMILMSVSDDKELVIKGE